MPSDNPGYASIINLYTGIKNELVGHYSYHTYKLKYFELTQGQIHHIEMFMLTHWNAMIFNYIETIRMQLQISEEDEARCSIPLPVIIEAKCVFIKQNLLRIKLVQPSEEL